MLLTAFIVCFGKRSVNLDHFDFFSLLYFEFSFENLASASLTLGFLLFNSKYFLCFFGFFHSGCDTVGPLLHSFI